MDYYYLGKDGQPKGPVGATELHNHGVTAETLLWTQNIPEWRAASTFPELAWLFSPEKVRPAVSPEKARPMAPPQKPNDLLVWSILATVLCCLPTGIVAIIQSNRVNTLYAQKNYLGAQDAAKNAQTWCIISLVLGIIALIIAVVAGLEEFM
jgi:hypothetical protein